VLAFLFRSAKIGRSGIHVTAVRLNACRVHGTATPPHNPHRPLPRPSPLSTFLSLCDLSLPVPPLLPSSSYLTSGHPPPSPHSVTASTDAHDAVGCRLQEMSGHAVMQSTDHARYTQGQEPTRRRRVKQRKLRQRQAAKSAKLAVRKKRSPPHPTIHQKLLSIKPGLPTHRRGVRSAFNSR